MRLLASQPWHWVGVPCVQSLMYAVNFEIIEEGKKKSSARVKGGGNHCDFQIGKCAYSRFREIWGEGNTSPSCTLVFFLLELVSPFHVDDCSQLTLGPG